jgi:hypothetical protein
MRLYYCCQCPTAHFRPFTKSKCKTLIQGGFCTNPRIGALSRAGVTSSRRQIIHTGLNSLSVGVQFWHRRKVSQGALSEMAGFLCLFLCLNSRFSQGLITSETSDGYSMTLIVTGVGLLPNAPVRGFVQRTPPCMFHHMACHPPKTFRCQKGVPRLSQRLAARSTRERFFAPSDAKKRLGSHGKGLWQSCAPRHVFLATPPRHATRYARQKTLVRLCMTIT